MYEVKTYARDKNGNRGALLATSKYPTAEAAAKAKSATIYLCKNQHHFPKEWKWNIKDVIIV